MTLISEEIHVNDIGTKFLLTVKDGSVAVDISSATTMQVKLRRPDGVVLTKTAVHDTDGVNGKMKYLTIAGDLSIAGLWKVQGVVGFSSPVSSWNTNVLEAQVFENL